MKYLSIAWHFLCSIPLYGSKKSTSPEEIAKAMALFPLIGLIFGIILYISHLALSAVFSPAICNILVLFMLALLSGAIHIDGLADSIDGFYGGKNKKEILKIMKDERVGAMALTGVLFNFLIKTASINGISSEEMMAGLILMPAIGRWSMVATAFFSNYAREGEGLGKPFTDMTTPAIFTIATSITLAAALSLLGFKGLITFLLTGIATLLIIVFSKKKIGGVTGDIIGASGEITETIFLLSLASQFQL